MGARPAEHDGSCGLLPARAAAGPGAPARPALRPGRAAAAAAAGRRRRGVGAEEAGHGGSPCPGGGGARRAAGGGLARLMGSVIKSFNYSS